MSCIFSHSAGVLLLLLMLLLPPKMPDKLLLVLLFAVVSSPLLEHVAGVEARISAPDIFWPGRTSPTVCTATSTNSRNTHLSESKDKPLTVDTDVTRPDEESRGEMGVTRPLMTWTPPPCTGGTGGGMAVHDDECCDEEDADVVLFKVPAATAAALTALT